MVSPEGVVESIAGQARMGRWGRVLVVRWPARPDALAVAPLRPRMIEARGQVDVLLHVIDFKDIQVPDEAARAELAALGREGEGMVRAAAALVAHGGLVLATARATILGIRIAAGSKMPFEITDDPSVLARFVGRHTNEPMKNMAEVLTALRAPSS